LSTVGSTLWGMAPVVAVVLGIVLDSISPDQRSRTRFPLGDGSGVTTCPRGGKCSAPVVADPDPREWVWDLHVPSGLLRMGPGPPRAIRTPASSRLSQLLGRGPEPPRVTQTRARPEIAPASWLQRAAWSLLWGVPSSRRGVAAFRGSYRPGSCPGQGRSRFRGSCPCRSRAPRKGNYEGGMGSWQYSSWSSAEHVLHCVTGSHSVATASGMAEQ